jgi:hypothetical protein
VGSSALFQQASAATLDAFLSCNDCFISFVVDAPLY